MTPTTVLAAAKAPTHPALRWTPIDTPDHRQHRRTRDLVGTVCGIIGHLTLAEATDERCTAGCW